MTMKKFLMLLCAVSALLVSCEKPDGPVNNGPVEGPVDNPMDKCEVPAQVRAGGEGTVIWNGFKENAQLLLDSEAFGEVQLTIKTITASGMTFSVPAATPEGEYMMILIQDGRHELGTVKVLPMQMPITGLDVPESAQQGETVTISGMGFKEGCRVVFEAAGEETEMAATLINGGIEVTLPEDMPAGKYKVSLIQDGLTWLLAENFEVYENLVIKQFSAIRYYAPYSEEAQIVMEWAVVRDEPVTFTVSEYYLENGAEELNAYDRYVMDASGLIALEHDGFEESNNIEVSYQKDSDGQVTVADVLRYGKKETTPFAWTYDSEGRLLDVSSPKASLISLEYEGDNLTSFYQMSFEYDADGMVNHPYAPDVVWAYMSLSLYENVEPFLYFPYFMGWYTETSSQLPARIVKPTPDGTSTVTLTLSYEFDADGYVTKMSWVDENENYAVEYRY